MGVGKHQTASIQRHRPSSGRIGEMLAAQINRLGGHFTEILDDDTSAFSVGARIDPDAPVHSQVPAGLVAVAPDMFEHCPPPTNRSLFATASTPPRSTVEPEQAPERKGRSRPPCCSFCLLLDCAGNISSVQRDEASAPSR